MLEIIGEESTRFICACCSKLKSAKTKKEIKLNKKQNTYVCKECFHTIAFVEEMKIKWTRKKSSIV